MKKKTFALIGISSAVIFWITYFLLSSLRPDYSMFTKAISELGSVDAPNKWMWNIFGYIIPGLLIAIYAWGLYKNVASTKTARLPLFGILLSGIFMSISGIFPGDFDNRESLTMLMHTIGSFGSYIFFLIGAFTYPKLMNKTNYWKSATKPTLILTSLTILFGAWPFVFPSIPAAGQRIVFLIYFLWIIHTAIKLYRQPSESPFVSNISNPCL